MEKTPKVEISRDSDKIIESLNYYNILGGKLNNIESEISDSFDGYIKNNKINTQ